MRSTGFSDLSQSVLPVFLLRSQWKTDGVWKTAHLVLVWVFVHNFFLKLENEYWTNSKFFNQVMLINVSTSSLSRKLSYKHCYCPFWIYLQKWQTEGLESITLDLPFPNSVSHSISKTNNVIRFSQFCKSSEQFFEKSDKIQTCLFRKNHMQ